MENSRHRVLHTFNAGNEKFSVGFFEFLQENGFDLSRHSLFHYGKRSPQLEKFDCPYYSGSLFSLTAGLRLLRLMFRHEKIVIHCLASPWLLFYLFLFPSLNKKVWWVMWGKDLYYYRLLENKTFLSGIYEFFRKKVFPRIGHLVTSTTGDYELAVEWYGCRGEHHECLMYPNNIYAADLPASTAHEGIRILVGNSADPSNRHFEIFDKLEACRQSDIQIIVPLSYGGSENARHVIERGKKQFGDKFTALTELLPLPEYQQLLADIDIAIFNHKRQQALGNIVLLLSDGKKIYLRSDATLWSLLQEQGIKVFDSCKEISLDPLNEEDRKKNIDCTRAFFSKENLLRDLKVILGYP